MALRRRQQRGAGARGLAAAQERDYLALPVSGVDMQGDEAGKRACCLGEEDEQRVCEVAAALRGEARDQPREPQTSLSPGLRCGSTLGRRPTGRGQRMGCIIGGGGVSRAEQQEDLKCQ
jgi:hypothetical protein